MALTHLCDPNHCRELPLERDWYQVRFMDSAFLVHRLHFAFTVTYHYLFPQLTMGLGPLIVALKSLAIWKKDETYNQSARFWAKIFGINFIMGVVTGIPM